MTSSLARVVRAATVVVALTAPNLLTTAASADEPTTARISGTVIDPDGEAVAGARVVAIRNLWSFEATVTDEHGQYEFLDLTPSDYFLTWRPPASRPDLTVLWTGDAVGEFSFASGMTSFPLDAGDDVVVDAQLPQGAIITGTVTDPEGQPVGGVAVSAAASPGGATYSSATTQADGTYTLGGLPARQGGRLDGATPDEVYVSFVAPPGSGLLGATGSRSVSPGDVASLNVTLPAGRFITARLFLAGDPIGATPMVGPAVCTGTGAFTGFSCPSGPFADFAWDSDLNAYRAGPLATGPHTIRAVAPLAGLYGPVIALEVPASGDLACDLALDGSVPSTCSIDQGAGPLAFATTAPDPVTGGTVTVQTVQGAGLSNVTTADPADLPGAPAGVTGAVIGYTVTLPPATGTALVDLYVADPDSTLDTAWKYQADTWREATSIATFHPLGDGRTRVRLSLVDNGPFDADSTVGVVVDPIAFGSSTVAPPASTFSGFQPPVAAAPALNQVKAGSTVPLRWRLTDASGEAVTARSALTGVQIVPGSCATPAVVAPTPVDASKVKITSTGCWQLEWKTAKAWRGCATLEVSLADGSVQRAEFSFR